MTFCNTAGNALLVSTVHFAIPLAAKPYDISL